jgi:acyl-CoA synthetase (NDP forming)
MLKAAVSRARGAGAQSERERRRLPSGSLDEAQAKQLFAAFAFPAPGRHRDHAGRGRGGCARIGGRVVLKILSSEITHKTEVGGVAIGLTPETVGARLTAMAADVEARAGVRPQRFLVQEMVGGGT